jgi:hypothetical protein
MELPPVLARWFEVPLLTRGRITTALVVAGAVDALQASMLPMTFSGADVALDLVAMFVISRLLGFHLLLLPTFLLEAVPVAGILPTWVGCTLAVVTLRRREQNFSDDLPAGKSPPDGDSAGNTGTR